LLVMSGAASPNRIGGAHGGGDQHGCTTRGAGGGGGALRGSRGAGERAHFRRAHGDGGLGPQARRPRGGRFWKRAPLVPGGEATPPGDEERGRRRVGKYAVIRDALTALWEASDRVCGKRLVVMIPTLQEALERHGQLQLSKSEAALLGSVSAATIDRLLGEVK